MRLICLALLLFFIAAPTTAANFHQEINDCFNGTSASGECGDRCNYCHDEPGVIGPDVDQSCTLCHHALVAADLHDGHAVLSCVDCHSIHGEEPSLLHMSNQNSALCLSCHAK